MAARNLFKFLSLDSKLLLKKGTMALSFKLVGVLAHFFLVFYINDIYGAEQLGIFSLSLTILQILFVLGKLGMDAAVLKFQGKYLNLGDRDNFKRSFLICLKIAAICSTILGAVVYLLGDFIATRIFNNPSLLFNLRIISISILPFSLTHLIGESFRAQGKSGLSVFVNGVARFLIAISMIYITVSWFEAYNPFLIFCIGLFVIFFFTIGFNRTRNDAFESKIGSTKETVEWKEIIKYSTPMLLVSSIQYLSQQVNIIVIGIIGDSIQVAQFSVLQKISLVLKLPLFAVNTVAVVLISKYLTMKAKEKLKQSAKKMSLLTFVASIPMFVIIFFYPQALLSIFGSQYVELGVPLAVLGIGQVVNSLAGSVGYLLQLSSHTIALRNITILALILNIGLSWLLIPKYGVLGACIGNMTSMIFMNLASSVYANKKFGFYPTFVIKT